jgi:hypothetical protein
MLIYLLDDIFSKRPMTPFQSSIPTWKCMPLHLLPSTPYKTSIRYSSSSSKPTKLYQKSIRHLSSSKPTPHSTPRSSTTAENTEPRLTHLTSSGSAHSMFLHFPLLSLPFSSTFGSACWRSSPSPALTKNENDGLGNSSAGPSGRSVTSIFHFPPPASPSSICLHPKTNQHMNSGIHN